MSRFLRLFEYIPYLPKSAMVLPPKAQLTLATELKGLLALWLSQSEQ